MEHLKENETNTKDAVVSNTDENSIQSSDITSIKTMRRSNKSDREVIASVEDECAQESVGIDCISENNGNLTPGIIAYKSNSKSETEMSSVVFNTTNKDEGNKPGRSISSSSSKRMMQELTSEDEASAMEEETVEYTTREECDKNSDVVATIRDDNESASSRPTVEIENGGMNKKEKDTRTTIQAASISPKKAQSVVARSKEKVVAKEEEENRSSRTYVEERTSLLTLPCDAMHFIASFLSPCDWRSLSAVSVASNKACRAVFRRVRLHGFRCATEVISAWVRGEHSDARELIALYVKSGVPIYPPCQGHTYSTLMWRMSVEAREMESHGGAATPEVDAVAADEEGGGGDKANTPVLDRFYTDRYEARERGVYFLPSLTYVEEKCLFWRYRLQEDAASSGSGRGGSGGRSYALPFLQVPGAVGNPQSREQRSSSPRRQQFSYRAAAALRGHEKVPVKIHRHLANQHYLGLLTVSDEDATGSISAGTISLSSDFLHESETDPQASNPARIVFHSSQHPYHSSLPSMLPTSHSMLTDFILQVYSGTTNQQDDHDCNSPKQTYTALQARFDSYFRKLANFLDNDNSNAFEECLLDFWDEFISKTKGIHFFDKHTPVPRMATLHDFLTKPCPKAIGIVQCEIQRIRRFPTSKRQTVKGRLFPTYEYRLFIRDRPSTYDSFNDSNSPNSDTLTEAKDAVLMTARNRGKHSRADTHANNYPSPPVNTNTKRGVNNYYLYMKTLSDHSEPPIDLGRLQSNFIGTEFQIFSPCVSHNKLHYNTSSDNATNTCIPEETDGQNDTNTDLVVHAHNSKHQDQLPQTSSTTTNSSTTTKTKKTASKLLRRQRSSTGSSWTALSTRTSRRAIANSEDTNITTSNTNITSPFLESEDGAITYTANLLGNRPRVMDVCVPRVNDDNTEYEWRQYCRNNEQTESNNSNNRMLSLFKQLQERLNNPDTTNEETNTANNDDLPSTSTDYGLLCLQNRPPWWNFELGAFVLNFGGRVSVASVKNFQLCDRNDQEHIMLQFGRIQGRHSFTMDFQYPLTAVQAFAIAISSLQSKISLG